ncbi:MAG: hypothetical protein UZ21_OP11001000309 [Microgenomates bacterium OLB22]|nr:MAG: hypothetical protein UZ21_OP11001000309 [Microgenomates bacterium OLB22]
MSSERLLTQLVKTVSYFSFFSYVPTIEEIWQFLPEKVTLHQLRREINVALKKYGGLRKEKGYLFLRGGGGIDIGSIERRKAISEKKLRQAHNMSFIFRINPFISFVGVTGSVAANNAKECDDIDVFVISYPHRMWIARLVMMSLLALWRKRRTPSDTDVRDKVCCNLWFDGTDISIPAARRTLFTAREILLLKPLMSRQGIQRNDEDTYTTFIRVNKWIYDFLPNITDANLPRKDNVIKKLQRPQQYGVLGLLANELAKMIQKKIMRPVSKEYITDTQLWFFPRDMSVLLRNKGLV